MMACIWLTGWHFTSLGLFGLSFFIEEREVIWIFCLISSFLLFGIYLKKLVRKLLFLVGRGRLFKITNAVMAMISRKHSMAMLTITSTDVTWVLMPWVAWSVFMAILVSNSCGGRSYSSLTGCVTSVRIHFWLHIFSLSNLRAIFHAICLLYEKHISVIMRRFHNFWSSPSVFHINSVRIVRLWTLWPMRLVISIWLADLTLRILILIFVWCSISCPESSKPRIVHLLLKQVAWVGVMNIILQSLY